jgi:hypothetical protein
MTKLQDDAPVATVLRLAPRTRKGLEFLQASLGMTMNKLMNEALAEYVAQRTAALEHEVQANLDRIKQHRRADPTFAAEFLRVAQAEAKYAKDDPVEGRFFIEDDAGPALATVRKVIRGAR